MAVPFLDLLVQNNTIIPRPRILADRCIIYIRQPAGGGVISMGEFDGFNAQARYEVKTDFIPAGEYEPVVIMDFFGWDVTITGGKVNSEIADFMADQELNFTNSNGEKRQRYMFPKVEILQKIFHFNGRVEEWVYEDAVLYNPNNNLPNNSEAVTEGIVGWAPRRRKPVKGINLPSAAGIVGGLLGISGSDNSTVGELVTAEVNKRQPKQICWATPLKLPF